MNRHHISIMALWLAIGAPASSASIPVAVRTSIVVPTLVVKATDLEFGSLYASGTSGSVTVTPNAARTTAGGVAVAPAAFHPAHFICVGGRNQKLNISLPVGPVTLTRDGGGATMTVSNFVRSGHATNPKLNNTGRLDLYVGGRLNVAPNQLPGNYSGSFNVTVNFE